MLKLTLVTSAIIVAGLAANQVNAAYVMTDKERESQLAHAYIEGNPTTKIQKQIAALTNGKEITGTIYKSDGSVDIKRTAQMLVKTNGKDPLVEMAKREAAAAAAAEIDRLNRLQALGVTIAQLEAASLVLADQLTTATTQVSTIQRGIDTLTGQITRANAEIERLRGSEDAANLAIQQGATLYTADEIADYRATADAADGLVATQQTAVDTATTSRDTANQSLATAQANKAGLEASILTNGADRGRAWEANREAGGYYPPYGYQEASGGGYEPMP